MNSCSFIQNSNFEANRKWKKKMYNKKKQKQIEEMREIIYKENNEGEKK